MPRGAGTAKGKGGKGGAELELFDNIQFIYELALAKMELEAFGVEFTTNEDMRSFVATKVPDKDGLVRRSAYLKAVDGVETHYAKLTRHNRTRSVNQFVTHWFYPYKGKFHPQLVRALMNILGLQRGDVLLDPFLGSGTTAVEARLMGVNCVGVDVSPVCVAVSKAKTQSLDVVDEISKTKKEVVENARGITLLNFQDPKVLAEVLGSIEDPKVDNFFRTAELITVSDTERRGRKAEEMFVKNVENMAASVEDMAAALKEIGMGFAYSDIRQGDATRLDMEDGSVDGIITSPPYSIALDYVKNDSHALKMLGVDIDEARKGFIGLKGSIKEKVPLYNRDMMAAYREMHRVLKPGKMCAIVIGNAVLDGVEVPTIQMTIERMKELGMPLHHKMDKIIFGLYSIMQRENILLFKKKG